MGNIAFMPQGNIFKGSNGITAQQPCHTGDFFTGNGVAFMRHGRRTFLAGRKIFFSFADIGALEVADFGCHFFQRRTDNGDGG